MNISQRIKEHVGDRLYPIGFKFELKRGSKASRAATVTDYEIAFNSGGGVVHFEYVVLYEFMGQSMKDTVPQTTIDMATNNGWKKLNEKKIIDISTRFV
jgi:hypothetical protein